MTLSAHPDVEYFWKGAAGGRLLLRRCSGCALVQHPAQSTPLCGTCHGTAFEEFPASGRGTVYTWIVSIHPGGGGAEPRIAAVIELAEGVRLVSNVVGVDAAAMRNGMAVEVCFVERADVVLPQFRPVPDPVPDPAAEVTR